MPLVVIQISSGVLFGPTLLAHVAPDFAALVFPALSLERLSGLAWLAVIILTFLTGLHLDVSELSQRGRAFFFIGVCSVITPFVFGVGAGLWALHELPDLAGPSTSAIGFSIAIGVAVSATALPVLGAILRETGLIYRRLGRLALGYAALSDVVVWIMIIALSTISGVSEARTGRVIAVVLYMLVYFGLMLFLIRPLLARLFARATCGRQRLTSHQIVLITAMLLGSALATEAVGLHYLIGALTAGVIMPNWLRPAIIATFEPLTLFVLLPFYFVVTGLKVSVDIESSQVLLFFLTSMLAAIGGKLLGTIIPSKIAGHSWREAFQLGALMQSKGLVEVVILTVLLDVGFISTVAFSALVLMALVTTALAMPMYLSIGSPEIAETDRIAADTSAQQQQNVRGHGVRMNDQRVGKPFHDLPSKVPQQFESEA